ncbi:MAG: aspartate dehydrogenase domain-containing protein [Bacteroidota bacterium]
MKVAILGFGKVGQTLFKTMQENPAFKQQFQPKYLWNRSQDVFAEHDIPSDVTICREIKDLLPFLPEIELVIECSHPSVLQAHAVDILEHTDLFMSSPTALGDAAFHQNVLHQLEQSGHRCYIPIGASIGIWDVIRLDQQGQIKNLKVTMKKHPQSFKLTEAAARNRLDEAMELTDQELIIATGNVSEINRLAPQNTNTMAIYALAAKTLGFADCVGEVVADQRLEAHIVRCEVVTHSGLKLDLVRDNPASHGAVTGSATFASFLSSVLHCSRGVSHGPFVFC